MLTVKHILFPLDFSDRSLAAIPFVEAMARRFNAKITLISAVQPFYYAGMGDPGTLILVDTDAMVAELKTRLEGMKDKQLAHLKVRHVCGTGRPCRGDHSFRRSTRG